MLDVLLSVSDAAVTVALTFTSDPLVSYGRSPHPISVKKLPSLGGRGWGRGLIWPTFHPHLTSPVKGEGLKSTALASPTRGKNRVQIFTELYQLLKPNHSSSLRGG
jgi:hypothetical protein